MGNIFGRIEGETDRVALFGSHLDTVKDGGKYDGAAGIVTSMTAISRAVKRLGKPRKSIEVVALVEEEGSRFLSSYTGSKAIMGKIGFDDLSETDSDGSRSARLSETLALMAGTRKLLRRLREAT